MEKNDTLPVDVTEKLTKQQLCVEYIFLSLRTKQGLNIQEFEKLGEFNFSKTFQKPLEKCKDFVLHEAGRIKLSANGFFLYNKICEEFVSVL